jgi:crossover junction endodeoxyribonuclease RuvC
VRIFGIDPGSGRTGYGCVETDGRRYRLVVCGVIVATAGDAFPHRLARIHRELTRLISACRPDCVAVENLFHGINARSALTLGHARGVAMLAAVEAGCEIVEYTPAEVKRAVVGYGRADKRQMQHMIKMLLGLEAAPSPHDAADALAVAICHLHTKPRAAVRAGLKTRPYGKVIEPNVVEAGLPPSRKASADHRSSKSEGGKTRRQTRLAKSWRHYRPPQ